MKKISLFVLALISAALSAQTAQSVIGTAKVDRAVVFLNGAELTSKANVALKKGENEVRIEGMSPVIDQNSLKVKFGNGVIISAFEYSTDYLSSTKNSTTVRAMQDSVEIYNKQLNKVNQDLQANKKMQELLLAGINNSMTAEKQPTSSEQIEKSLTYYQTRMSKLTTEATALQEKQNLLNSRIKDLNSQIRQDGLQNNKRAGVLKLTVNAPKAGNAQAEITYFTSRAYWTPFYDISVAGVGKPIDLNLKGHIAQTTGLDWTQVALTLSTGTPSRSNQLPQLNTWFLRREYKTTTYRNSANLYLAKAAQRGVAAEPMMADEMMIDEMMIEEAEDKADRTIEDFVRQTEQALSAEYEIDLPYTILGTGKQQTISLNKQQATDVTYKYVAIPKLDGSVYLTAQINNYNQLSLLDGIANLTVGDTYFGQTMINASGTEDKLNLTLGDDPTITVKREKISDKSKNSGKEKQQTITYRLTVRNNKQESVNISLQEPYPISTTKEIVVELSDKSSKWSSNDTERGILTFEEEIAAGTSKEFNVTYTVKYPKDWEIGL